VKTFDLIVLGGGSGGLATAQRAAEYGARVALFEPARLGGTCVNVGCVPKKVMWNAAELAEVMAHASHYGFRLSVDGHDWSTLKKGRDAYVARLNGIYARNLARKDVGVIESKARFRDRREVEDEHGQVYRADQIVIATGAYPRMPEVEGAELGITSDGFFELEQMPRRVAIVGSGYVAVEFAGVLNALGSEVHVFMRFDTVLRSFDQMLSQWMMESMRSAGIELVTGAVPRAVTGDRELALETMEGRRFEGFDALIWAVGRAPNTDGLGLEAAGVKVGDGGFIEIDRYQNTSADGIYALGDVAGTPELTPVAIAAGRRLADRVFGGQAGRYLSYELIPTVLFSHPPIGTVGLTGAEAREPHGSDAVRIYSTEFVPMFFALTEKKPRMAMKLVTVGEEERVVGCHIAGPAADEILQGFAVAISMGARKKDLDDTIAIHPTSAEELVTMR
jgi:glutathione reductase (NADPH)